MWKYWSAGDAANNTSHEEHDERDAMQDHAEPSEEETCQDLMRLPPIAGEFSSRLEEWIKDQCASVGCHDVSLSINTPTSPRKTSSATPPPRKRAKSESGDCPKRTCPLCDMVADERVCPMTGTLHVFDTDVNDCRVKWNDVTGYYDRRSGACKLAQFKPVNGLIGVSGRVGLSFGPVPRSDSDGEWARCLYSVRMKTFDVSALVPPAMLSTTSLGDISLCERTTEVTVMSGNMPLASAAVAGALSKVAFFSAAPDAFDEENIPLLAAAVRARYPDTALFHSFIDGVPVFCVCGIGSAYVCAWLSSAAIVTVPSIPSCVNLAKIGELTSCGISASSSHTPDLAEVWEMHGGGDVWRRLHSADCHMIAGHMQRGTDRVVATTLAHAPGVVYRIDLLALTATPLHTGETQPLRRTGIMVPNLRLGDIVRAGDDIGPAEVVRLDGHECSLKHKNTWQEGLPVEHTQPLNVTVRREPENVRIAVFGSPQNVQRACQDITLQCTYKSNTLFLPKGLGSAMQGRTKDIRQATGVANIDVMTSSVVLSGTTSQLEDAGRMVACLLQQYLVNLQYELMKQATDGVMRRLTAIVAQVPLHAGLHDAVQHVQSFDGMKKKSHEKQLRTKLSQLKRREEMYQRESMLMFTGLDDYASVIKGIVSSAVSASPNWDTGYLMLGLSPNAEVEVNIDSGRLRNGDRVRIKHSVVETTHRWSAVQYEIGTVTNVTDPFVKVDFPSHLQMQLFISDVEPEEQSRGRVHTTGAVQVSLQDEGATIQFGKSITRWITSTFEGVGDVGRPTCVVAEFVNGRNLVRLVCPNTAQLTAVTTMPGSDASLDERLMYLAQRLVQLKWHSLCDALLATELLDVVHSTATAERAIVTLQNVSSDAELSCKDLHNLLEGLKAEASTVCDVLTKDNEVVFTDTDGDTNEIALVGPTLFYVPIGKRERTEVHSVQYDPATAELGVCLGDQTWKMRLVLSTGVLPRLACLVKRSGVSHNFCNASASYAEVIALLQQRTATLATEWHTSLSGASAELRYHLTDLRAEAATVEPKCLFGLKERVDNISGAVFDLEDCVVKGHHHDVATAVTLLEAEACYFGSLNTAIFQLPTSILERLQDSESFLLSLLKESSGVESASISQDELALVGTRGAIEHALQILRLKPSDAIFRNGPDTQMASFVPPNRCCGKEGDTIALSCGHVVHPGCVLRDAGLRCCVCRALLRFPEIKRVVSPALVLTAISEQTEHAFAEDKTTQRCACGIWVAVQENQVSICTNCATVIPPSIPSTEPTTGHDPLNVACWKCWKPLTTNIAINTTQCVSRTLCEECAAPGDARQLLSAVPRDSPHMPVCRVGHPLVPSGKQVCWKCKATSRSSFYCERCCYSVCGVCASMQGDVHMMYCDEALLAEAGLKRKVKTNSSGGIMRQHLNDFASLDVTGSTTQTALHFLFLLSEASATDLPSHLVPTLKISRMRAGIMGRGLHPALLAQFVV